MPTVVNGGAVLPILQSGSSARFGVTVVSDSNGRFNGYGIQNGLITALRDRFPQYATGAIPAHVVGSATGFGSAYVAGTTVESYYIDTSGGVPPLITYDGANAALDTYMDPDVTDVPDRYVYYNGAASAYIASQHSYILFNNLHNLYRYQKTNRYHFTYGTFPSGTNSIRPGRSRLGR